MFWGWGMGGWTMAFVGLMCVAVWGLLVVALVALLGVSRRAAGPDGRTGAISARELLAQRYARGEIDEEELRRRLAVVDQSTVPSNLGR